MVSTARSVSTRRRASSGSATFDWTGMTYASTTLFSETQHVYY